jgi:hypothetical protein
VGGEYSDWGRKGRLVGLAPALGGKIEFSWPYEVRGSGGGLARIDWIGVL